MVNSICPKQSKEVKKKQFSDEPLCAFANSCMNIEFVYLILLGINNFLDTSRELDAKAEGKQLKITKNKDDTQITFCNIRFNDIE